MTQAPATPKLRRARHRMAARLGLPPAGALAPSETAALALRRARLGETWHAPDHVTYLIPLVGPDKVGDWDAVTGLLAKTLTFFLAQSDPRWRAVICCEVRPDLPADDRITFLPFEDARPGNDKWRKLDALYGHLASTAERAGLAMTFDADDLAAPDLTGRLLAHRHGALLTHGHVYDAAHDRLALARPQSLARPGAKAFWKLCGSCAALPYDPRAPSTPEQWAFLRAMSQHEHRMIPYLATLAGSPLAQLNQPLVLYLLNHGENFGARRGRVSFKTRFTRRFEIRDSVTRDALRTRYDLP